MEIVLIVVLALVGLLVLGLLFANVLLGLVVIGERQVGIVVKKFDLGGKRLPPGQLIALQGEAGYQADTLAPGWHFFYWPWQYAVLKAPVVIVPQGEIALIVANDGAAIPQERILGKGVACDNLLWTTVRGDGKWWALPQTSKGFTQKVFWWREGYQPSEEPQPDLTVTGRRLDGDAPPIRSLRATNATAGDIGAAMLIGVSIPTLGCWEFTGEYNGHTLTFVVWVAP